MGSAEKFLINVSRWSLFRNVRSCVKHTKLVSILSDYSMDSHCKMDTLGIEKCARDSRTFPIKICAMEHTVLLKHDLSFLLLQREIFICMRRSVTGWWNWLWIDLGKSQVSEKIHKVYNIEIIGLGYLAELASVLVGFKSAWLMPKTSRAWKALWKHIHKRLCMAWNRCGVTMRFYLESA